MNLLALELGTIIALVVVGVIVLLAVIFGIWWISTYNKLVKMKNGSEEAISTIDVYLKKRYDLIPNLVETVKGYASHEKETFVKVTEARAMASSAVTPEEKVEADKAMTQAIRNFNMVMESYPELKANVNFMDLQRQLQGIENELANSRKYYNGNVKVYNNVLLSFPSNLVAKAHKFKKLPYFEITAPAERENVKVSF